MERQLCFSVLFSFCFLSLWLVLATAQAQTTRFVSTTGTNTNPSSATSWATSTTNLQGAIDASTTNDQVWVGAGVYKPTSTTDRTVSFAMKNGVGIYGGFAGSETALSQRPTINPVTGKPSSSTLSGEIGDPGSTTDNSNHVINNPKSLSLNNSAVLDGFVITGGYADTGIRDIFFYPGDMGGGVYNDGNRSICSPTFRNCSLLKNEAYSSGGAMINDGVRGNSSPILTNCVFQSNSARQGGAINNSTSDFGVSSPILTNCAFIANTAYQGGAIENQAGYKGYVGPQLTNVSFQNNSATTGGAFYNDGSYPTLTNCSFKNNTSPNGGAMNGSNGFYGPSEPTLINCVLFGNGGATTFTGTGTVTASYSLFDNAVTGYSASPTNLTTTSSPFASISSVALVIGSSAIDAGLSSAPGLAGITTDLAGNPRVMGCRVDRGAVEFENNTDGLPTVFITLPNGSTVSVAGNLPTLTLLPNGPLMLQVSGGSTYERVIILDRLNGYEIRQVDQNTTGIFPINRTGLFTLTVMGANGCSRTVQGVVQAP